MFFISENLRSVINIIIMALGSIQKAKQVFQEHDFSRQNQIRILDVGPGVPAYVRQELIEKPVGAGGYLYATSYAVPGRTINNIQVPFQGFNFNIPGQVSYEPNPWTVTFNTPGDYLVRNAMERWSFATINEDTSCGSFNFPCDTASIDLAVLSPQCKIMRVYRLIGVYPQSVGPIEYDQTAIERTTFQVALHYQMWRPVLNFDSGAIDVDNRAALEIDSIYSGFESQILANNSKSCGITPV